MSMFIAWAVVCFFIALVLFVLEVVVPSAGILALLSGIAAVTGVVLLFIENQTLGLVGVLVCLVAIPFLIGTAIKVWPSTPLARMLTLTSATDPSEDDATDGTAPLQAALHHEALVVVGTQGKAISELRPVGVCRFGDQRVDCLANDGLIESGALVEVVAADGMQIKVRRVTPHST